MLITDDFVMINFPRTASTFARNVITTAYKHSGRPIIDLSLPVITDSTLSGKTSQHGTVDQIPFEHRHKEIVSILRNPFDRYVSLYTFKWWQTHPPAPAAKIKTRFKSFPDLAFPEYLRMVMEFTRNNIFKAYNYHGPAVSGINTMQHVAYYSRKSLAAFESLAANGNKYDSIFPYMENVTFLSQENLRSDIYNYLCRYDFYDRDLSQIMTMPALNASRPPTVKRWEEFYDNRTYDEIFSLERPILEKFFFNLQLDRFKNAG